MFEEKIPHSSQIEQEGGGFDFFWQFFHKETRRYPKKHTQYRDCIFRSSSLLKRKIPVARRIIERAEISSALILKVLIFLL